MTEEEKKEFEEFLIWKKEKDAKEREANDATKEASQESGNDKENLETVETTSSMPDNSVDNPDNSSNSNIILVFFAIGFIVIILILVVIGTCQNADKNSFREHALAAEDSIEEIEEVEVVVVDPEPSKAIWDFTITQDEMTDTKNIWATIKSENYISQDFPYEGYTYASITVRYMKKYGYDVIIQITKGQINGREYYGTHYVTARFDEGSPKKILLQ